MFPAPVTRCRYTYGPRNFLTSISPDLIQCAVTTTCRPLGSETTFMRTLTSLIRCGAMVCDHPDHLSYPLCVHHAIFRALLWSISSRCGRVQEKLKTQSRNFCKASNLDCTVVVPRKSCHNSFFTVTGTSRTMTGVREIRHERKQASDYQSSIGLEGQ